MTCFECGLQMGDDERFCTSNLPDGDTPASCRVSSCPGRSFCSSRCLQACWRRENWPKVTYLVRPAIDKDCAINEAVAIVETAMLEGLWK